VFGLLNIDKPAGMTSRDVVNRVQRLVKPHKVGHAGTLDPLATGVLVVAIGPATRLIEYVQRLPKTYQATFRLGFTSDTEDIEGQVKTLPPAAAPTQSQLRAAIPQFLGTIQQTPPAYSALKVEGQRAYKLARRGAAVELAARPVEIHSLEILRYVYPELELLIRCGSGTYIRSLGRDLAQALGTGAVMSALRRQAIGPFEAAAAIPLANWTMEQIDRRLQPPQLALGAIPQIEIDDANLKLLSYGQSIGNRQGIVATEAAAIHAGRLVAILVPDQHHRWRPEKFFAAE